MGRKFTFLMEIALFTAICFIQTHFFFPKAMFIFPQAMDLIADDSCFDSRWGQDICVQKSIQVVAHADAYSTGTEGLLPGCKGDCSSHLVPRLRKSGAKPPLNHTPS